MEPTVRKKLHESDGYSSSTWISDEPTLPSHQRELRDLHTGE